jgi:hypothetical protein
MKGGGGGPATPSLPAPPGVIRRRTQTATVASAPNITQHVGTPMPVRLPGLQAPRSEPVNVRELDRFKQKKPPVEKKQQQDLISSEDSWTMTREREERYRAEIEAQVRQEMAVEEEMRASIEAQVRKEMEEEMETHRRQLEDKLRREMEMQAMKELGLTPIGPSPGPGRKDPVKDARKGHVRKASVTNSAREMRAITPKPSNGAIARRPLPPPPPAAPRPLSPRKKTKP